MTSPYEHAQSASTASAAWGGWRCARPGAGPSSQFVHINELKGDAATAAHLLTFDSVHGRWTHDVHGEEATLVDRRTRDQLQQPRRSRATCRGATMGVDIVLECSGKFRTPRALGGLLSAGRPQGHRRRAGQGGGAQRRRRRQRPLYDPDKHHLADRRLVHDQLPGAGREGDPRGHRHPPRRRSRRIHDMTNTQTIVDAPHKDLRRARAASLSLIPTTTGSATAIGLIYPELKGKLNGLAVRVPLLNASLTDCVFEVARPTTVEEVNAPAQDRGRRAARGHPRLRGAAAGLGRLQGRSALGDRRRALDDGRRRHAGEDPGLVRQRVGLRQPHGGAGPQGRAAAWPSRRRRRRRPTTAHRDAGTQPTHGRPAQLRRW